MWCSTLSCNIEMVKCSSKKCRTVFRESKGNNMRKYKTCTVLLCISKNQQHFEKNRKKTSPLMSALKYWYKCCSVDELFLLWISSFLLFSASISAAQSDFYLSKNPILWFKPTTPLPPPPSSLLLLSQQGIVSPPVKIKLTIFSADIVLLVSSITSRNFNDFGLSQTLRSSRSNVIFQLANQHRWSTLFRDYCDRLPLTSSCIPMTTQL